MKTKDDLKQIEQLMGWAIERLDTRKIRLLKSNEINYKITKN